MATPMKGFRHIVLCSLSKRLRLLSSKHIQWIQSKSNVSVKDENQSDITQIVIPKRKHRNSTSILEALASTVKRDTNAADYMFIDDPFLIPTEFLSKKHCALAKASGRHAARYVIDRNPNIFTHDLHELNPIDEAFKPQKIKYEITEANEAALKERIELRKTIHAIEIYKQIKLEGGELSLETKLDLLDLLCVYNSKDPPPPTCIEEDIYPPKQEPRNLRKQWQDDGEAEKLFEDLPEKTGRVYNTIVTGMAKYLASEKAYDLYKEMLDKQIPVDVETFTELIRYCSLMEDRHDMRWTMIREFLLEMKNQGLQPTMKTFESVLCALSYMAFYRPCPDMAMKVFSEMKKFDIEPTLGSLKCVIEIFYLNENCQSDMLEKVIMYTWGKKFVYHGPDDYDFLHTAMIKCHNVLKDVELAKKIEELAQRNQGFLGNAFRKTYFYSSYFRLLCMYDSLEKVMEEYSRLVPHIWFPTYQDFEELFKTIDLYDGFHYLPQIWLDIDIFDFGVSSEIVSKALNLMAKKCHPEQLQNQLCDIAETLLAKWKIDNGISDKWKKPIFTAPDMGYLIQICVHGNRFPLAWEMFVTLQNNSKLFANMPGDQALAGLVQQCIDINDVDKAMELVTYMADQAIPKVQESITKILSEMELTDSQRDQLSVL